jgi:hypothetical protein
MNDEASRLQLVEYARKRRRLDIENVSETSSIDPLVLCEISEDRAFVAAKPKLRCVVKTSHCNVRLIALQCLAIGLASSRGLLQQTANGCFVRPVATDQLLHDGLTEKLVDRRLCAKGAS